MKHFIFGLLANVCLIALLHAVPQKYATARIDVESSDRSNELTPAACSDGGKLINFDWLSNGKWGVYANFPFGSEPTAGDFTFRSAVSCSAKILLRGPYWRDGNRVFPFPVTYSSVSINGRELLSSSVTVTHDGSLTFPGELTAGESIRIQVRYSMEERFLDRGETLPLDLRPTANMGFADPVAGDGEGGWTDQGSKRDLSLMIPGERTFDGAKFDLIDPAQNRGKAILAFASTEISPKINLKKVSLPVPLNSGFTHLYLLHTAGYGRGKAQAAIIRCTFEDGAQKEFPVLSGHDLGDWWRPIALPNAAVVERFPFDNASGGYYLSQFRLSDERRQIREIELETCAGEAIWLVLGATLGNRALDLKKVEAKSPVFIAGESRDWRIFAERDLTVRPGSILDFGDLFEFRPITAGERVVIANGVFMRNGKRIRFTGCSSTESDTLGIYDKKQIEEYAKLIRRQGYNLYRPHFLDFFLMEGAERDLEFNPENLDKFDYLIHCLKQEGIYLYLDAMTAWSGYAKGSGWDWESKGLPNYKNLLFGTEEARAHWKTGVQKLLRHVNPYTGTELLDDPVLIAILPLNEQELSKPLEVPEVQEKWKTFAGKNDLPFPNLMNHSPEAEQGRRFMAELYREMDEFYRKELREIGYRGPLSMYDCTLPLRNGIARSRSELISMHLYQSHPRNWVRPGSALEQESTIRNRFKILNEMFVHRQPGKPFMVIEYLHCFWDKYRFEQGLSQGALSVFQDIDGIMNHQLPVFLTRPVTPIATFRIYQDPVARASEVVSNAVYLNQAAAPAATRTAFRFDPDKLLKTPFAEQRALTSVLNLCLSTQVATLFNRAPVTGWRIIDADETLAQKSSKDFAVPPQETFFRLDEERETFSVLLPEIEGIAALNSGDYRLGKMRIRNSRGGSFTLISRDRLPLPQSNRMLLVVATDALNRNMRFSGDDRHILQTLGGPEVLLQTVRLEIELERENAVPLKLYAVRQNGVRAEELPLSQKGGGLSFTVDTTALKDGPVLFFELNEK